MPLPASLKSRLSLPLIAAPMFLVSGPALVKAACRAGVIGSFPMAVREELFTELQHLVTEFEGHPWNWAAHQQGERTPRKNEVSRWNNGKDLSFVPLRPERVVEVRYDYMEGLRFRHTAQFERWRPDREPRSCTYLQLERPVRFQLADVLTSR